MKMAVTCAECKNFFALEDDPTKGDCVLRVVDPKCAYWKAKPQMSDMDASGCGDFQSK